ncbi:MAG TPA: serine/threonine-protein kinase [Kofleriaceae bacterium]|nr:serine/threonine-protein kinase [Kofleriaceae bacterium]
MIAGSRETGGRSTDLAASRPDHLLGRRIAGYVLDEVIGVGGMGTIYGATSRCVQKRAAVKVMLHEYTEDPEVVGRFLQEAFVASAVDHPNVVEIWAADRFEEDGRMYILMPLIEGASLEVLCEHTGPFGLDAAATIAIQIAAGLDAVHELGVVHRDINPANILIAKRRGLEHFVKIVDFGIASLLAPHVVGAPADRRTRTDMVIGTAGSMAPEQAAGSRDVDARADIYSWGVVLYHMLTGRPPYQGDSVWELVERARRGESFPRPRALRPDLPRAWDDVIMASLELDPHRRPNSMKEVVQRIAAPLPRGAAMLSALAPNLTRDPRLAAADQALTDHQDDHWSVARPRGAPRARALPIAIALASGVGVAAGIVNAQIAGDAQPETPLRAPAPPAPVLPQPSPVPAPPAPVSVPPATGLLIVRASPWAKVWIDDEALGQTAVRRTVQPGAHRIRLVGPDDRTQELARAVQAGETVSIRWDW